MKRNKTVKTFISMAVAALLLISMLLGLPLEGMIQIAKADSTGTFLTTDLPLDTGAAAQLKALGLPVDQPSRTDPSGNVIDKKANNPLGAQQLVLNKTLQLATAGVNNNFNELYDIYDKPISGSGNLDYSHPLLGPDKLTGTQADPAGDWRRSPKAMTSADINGTGKDTVITAALPSLNANTAKLELIVTDYNGGKTIEKELVVVSSLAKPIGFTDVAQYPIHTAAGDFNHDGKDEVAVVVGRTLYICQVTQTSATILSQITFDENCAVAQIMNTNSDIPRIDVKSGDVDKDGYKELLVTTGSSNGGATYTPKLLIYHGTDAMQPEANIELKVNNSLIFRSANVAVGDLLGDGVQAIVLGGWTTANTTPITYIKYHASTKTTDAYYDTVGTNPLYNLSIPKVYSNLPTLNCVSLETPIPGQGQFVVFGDDIFKYDSKANNGKGGFVKHNVSNSTYGNGNISGANYGSGDNTYILNTIVGNFDGNTLGKEQIIMLHWNNWWSSPWEYITWCGEDTKGNIVDHMGPIWNGGQYNFPAICAPDVYDNGVRFQYDRSEFTFSDPKIIAVLGASPYYQELNYGDTLNQAATTFGTDDENKGVAISAGVSFGYDKNSTIYGLKPGGTDLETLIKQKFTDSWSPSASVSQNYGFTADSREDRVVVSTIPYDVYYYNVYNSGNQNLLNINLPYAPVTKIMSLKDYNQAVETNNLANLPIVGPEVLKHTAGDPRTYPGDALNLSNVSGKSIVKGNDFVRAGFGHDLAQQAINVKATDSSLIASSSENLTFQASAGGVNVGLEGNSGYNPLVGITLSPGIPLAGSVANLPEGDNSYDFAWKLAAYNYDLPIGDSTQSCTVLAYLVNSVTGMPPGVPANLKAVSVSSTAVTLQWDKVSTATGYEIRRSSAKEGPYTKVGDVNGIDSPTYTDSSVVGNQTYYYEVLASSSSVGMASEPLTVQTTNIKSISVDTQPKLFYTKGDLLDLSSLVVALHLNDGSTQTVGFADFATNSLTVSPANGDTLSATQNGVPITITYTPSGQSVQTNELAFNVDSSHNFTVSSAFKVGKTDNATELSPNALLTAKATVKNNQSSAQNIVVVVALYDGQGNTVNISYLPESIEAGASVATVASFRLPADVTNYSAKVFVWDGSDLSSSSQTLQSNVVKIPQ